MGQSLSQPVPGFAADALWQALGRLDRLLERATASADAAFAAGGAQEPYRGLYITAEDVRKLIRRNPGDPFLAGAEPGAAEAMPEASRFPWLAQRFDLTPFDLDVILLTLAPEVDLRYERLYAYLQDDVTRRRPSVDLALNLLCATREAKIGARARFAPDAPLVRGRLLQLIADGAAAQPPLLAHALKLDDSLIRFLLGHPALDGRLVSFAAIEAPAGSPDRTAAAVAARLGLSGQKHFSFEGPAHGVKRAAAAALAAGQGAPLIAAGLDRMPAPAAEFEAALDALFRDAELLGGVLLLERAETLRAADREPHLETLQAHVSSAAGIVILCGERPCDPRFTTLAPVVFQEPGYEDRRQTWSAALSREGVNVDGPALQELATRYRLDAEQIDRAVSLAARQAALDIPASPVGLAHLTLAAREQLQRDPGSLARKLRPSIPWDRLVLPSDQVAQLRELCQHARFRHVVFGQWGFERKLSTGKGLSALFSGPPGTGKTMAAEVIATDLGLDLYKIDLSQVVSKYIGETEKNMDKLFTEARLANAILFFDECDALFGKRTTVQDAHDRYANIEISYLLQKMDEYEGLSILATNLRQNLDAAFVRRLNFIIEFPFPDESSRRRIWETIWPEQLPRSRDLDLEFMAAQFKLPGGAVRNIAVAAAFLAAGGKGEVTTEHLLRATRRELEKAGRSVSRTEYGRYADLVAPAAAAATSGGRP